MLEARASTSGTDSEILEVMQALETNVERLQKDLSDRNQELLLGEVELRVRGEPGSYCTGLSESW